MNLNVINKIILIILGIFIYFFVNKIYFKNEINKNNINKNNINKNNIYNNIKNILKKNNKKDIIKNNKNNNILKNNKNNNILKKDIKFDILSDNILKIISNNTSKNICKNKNNTICKTKNDNTDINNTDINNTDINNTDINIKKYNADKIKDLFIDENENKFFKEYLEFGRFNSDNEKININKYKNSFMDFRKYINQDTNAFDLDPVDNINLELLNNNDNIGMTIGDIYDKITNNRV
jgi:hypothetical protein